MGNKKDVWQGTLALMVLKTLETMGPLHGYGIARRIEQTSGDLLSLNYGTLYPALLKLEQEGSIASEWGTSENNRKAKFYRLTRAGRKQLEQEAREWEQPPRSWRASCLPVRSRHEELCARWRAAWRACSRRTAASRNSQTRSRAICRCRLRTICARGCRAERRAPRAILKLGGVEQTRQAYRERGTMPFIENLLYDIRYTLRQCRRDPGFAVTAVIVLGAGHWSQRGNLQRGESRFSFGRCPILEPIAS